MRRLEDVIDPAKDRVRLVPGYAAEGNLVSIGGLVQSAIWTTGVIAVKGDPIQVLVVDRPDAPSMFLVIGRTGRYEAPVPAPEKPWEGTVATAPVGSDTITVDTTALGTVTATFVASYTPAVSDRVGLQWLGNKVRVVGKVGVTPTPPPDPEPEPAPEKLAPVAPPPPKKSTGTNTFTASNSGTFSSGYGVWNSYYKTDLYQGFWSGPGNNRGAWFYHGKPGLLKGKTARKVEIWLPPRRRAGSYNSSVDINIYLHGSKTRPSGDVTRGASTSITIPANFGGGWKTLPASWGDDIISGDGIGIAGGSYAGLEGIGRRSASGQIRINWEA